MSDLIQCLEYEDGKLMRFLLKAVELAHFFFLYDGVRMLMVF